MGFNAHGVPIIVQLEEHKKDMLCLPPLGAMVGDIPRRSFAGFERSIKLEVSIMRRSKCIIIVSPQPVAWE